jgi:riboflavin kinase / FMN adenylyltransferase
MLDHSVFDNLAHARACLTKPVVTIGNFDGVHVGHQAIFERVRSLAGQRGASAAALTFEPHPVRFFRPDAPAFRLTTTDQKLDLMAQYGLDASIVLPFDEHLASLTPEGFVDEVLEAGLAASCVVVGSDFAFGKGRAGTIEDLERLCAERGIGTEIVSHVEIDGEPVSSTRVRGQLEQGHVEELVRLLGRPYRIAGEVVRGDQRGRKLGFPTANLATTNPLLPPNGVYATTLHVTDLPALHSITNVGTRPTFGGGPVTVESFVLNHDDTELDLYGKDVQLDFWRFIRPERHFDDPAELVEQIERDIDQVKNFFTL